MPKALEFAAPQVPIVGQKVAVHAGYVMATATCKCRPDNQPFLIQGGFLERTARGRVATARAYEYFGLPPAERDPRLW